MHKRIVLIRSNPVAPYPRLEKMANTLFKNGYDIHVLAWDRERNYEATTGKLKLVDGVVPITRVGIKGEFAGGLKKNLLPLVKFQIFIFKWLKKYRATYDIIHAYDFDTGFMAQKCAKLFKKKLVYDIPDYYVDSHGLKGSHIGNWVQKKENYIINMADLVIICTEKRKEQIKGTNPKKLVVIHNTPDDKQLTSVCNPKYKFDTQKLKLAYIGVFGQSRFLDKIAEVVEEREDCEFHIGGYGSNMETYFEKKSERCEDIKYYGKVPYNETLFIEENCDIICAIYDPKVPNHYYAAPNKFYEALMLGKPLIMAYNTGMDQIVLKNDIGIVIEYDKESLNSGLNRLLLRKNEWGIMGKRARELYDKKFSWAVMEEKIKKSYEELYNY